jgi:hypothetical protein
MKLCLSLKPSSLALATFVATYSYSQSSEACTCSPQDARFSVTNKVVPSNLPAVVWKLTGLGRVPLDTSSIVWVKRNGNEEMPVEFRVEVLAPTWVHIVPAQPLEPYSSYQIRAAKQVSAGTEEINFATAGEVPLPTVFDAYASPAAIESSVHIDSQAICSSEFPAIISDVSSSLALENSTWKELLLYDTYVDGQRWSPRASDCEYRNPGASWRGYGIDTIYAFCEGSDKQPGLGSEAVAPGMHEVEMTVTIPGTTTVFRSSKIAINFECPDPSSTSTDSSSTGDTSNSTTTSTSQMSTQTPGQITDEESGCVLARSQSRALWAWWTLPILGMRRRVFARRTSAPKVHV